jgi:hypothetical protein
MKAALALIILCLAVAARAEDKPSLLLYISPSYTQEVRLGVQPYYGVWVDRIDAAKSAAHKHLAPFFSTIEACEGINVGDMIAKIKPQLTFNPMLGFVQAQVKIEFNLGDGRDLGTLSAVGQQFGFIDSPFVQDDVRKAFDKAMQSIAEKYAADTRLQENIRAGLASDFKRPPCGVIGLMPSR